VLRKKGFPAKKRLTTTKAKALAKDETPQTSHAQLKVVEPRLRSPLKPVTHLDVPYHSLPPPSLSRDMLGLYQLGYVGAGA
jgi:hypothetical protein